MNVMYKLGLVLTGALSAVALLLGAVAVFMMGANGLSAREQPGPLEKSYDPCRAKGPSELKHGHLAPGSRHD